MFFRRKNWFGEKLCPDARLNCFLQFIPSLLQVLLNNVTETFLKRKTKPQLLEPFFGYSWKKTTWENFVGKNSTKFRILMKKLLKKVFQSRQHWTSALTSSELRRNVKQLLFSFLIEAEDYTKQVGTFDGTFTRERCLGGDCCVWACFNWAFQVPPSNS